MNARDRRSDWTVLIGIGLVVLGAWLLLGRFFGWIVAPVTVVLAMVARVGWPLVLIAIGIILVLRARGGGWNPAGGRIFRSRSDRMVTGVLGGVAKWMGVNPMPVRVFYVLFTLLTGVGLGIVLYVLGTILLPEEPYQTVIDGTAVPINPTPPPAPPVPGRPAPQPPTGSFVTREAPMPPPVAPPAPAPEPAPAPPVPPAAPAPPAPEPAASGEPPAAPDPNSGFEPPAPPEDLAP